MKGVIIAAGYGSRFLPASKTIPKEMFPLIDIPAIHFIVEELILSGIKDILIVTSRRKKALEDYFDRDIELESFFEKKKNDEVLKKIAPHDANFFFLRQQKMSGTGHAIMICKEFVNNDSFVVAYPDDIVFSQTPLARQMIDAHKRSGGSVLSMLESKGDVSRYGVIDFTEDNGVYNVKKIVEKPSAGMEPSKMISIGRYLFEPEIFELLEKNYKNHSAGEFYHIDAINTLAERGRVRGCLIEGERIDIGEPLGYLESIIKYSLLRKDLKQGAEAVLRKYQ